MTHRENSKADNGGDINKRAAALSLFPYPVHNVHEPGRYRTCMHDGQCGCGHGCGCG